MKGLTEFQRSQYYAKYKKGTAKGLKEADTILKVLPLLDVLMDAIEDLEKAAWYVNREIKKRKAKIEPEWPQDETRIDVIGTNGNTGDHYQDSDQVVYATKHEIR